MEHKYRIHINNDEIDLISDRIEEIQSFKDENNRIPDEYVEEYDSLFKIKNILFNANRIEDPADYFVYGSMRLNKKDIKKFLMLINNVHVKGLDFFIPTFNNDTLNLENLTGSNLQNFDIGKESIKNNPDVVRDDVSMYMPLGYDQQELAEKAKNDANINKLVTKIRTRRESETIPEYEKYLENIYKNYIELENVSFYPGTTVPIIRKPYPHEMYYITKDGYTFDSKYFGRRNKYYLEMVEYYSKERDNQLLQIKEEMMKKEYVSPLDKKRVRVTKVEHIPKDLVDQTQELVETNDEKRKKQVIEMIKANLGLVDSAKKTIISLINNGNLSDVLSGLNVEAPDFDEKLQNEDVLNQLLHNIEEVKVDSIEDLINDTTPEEENSKVIIPKILDVDIIEKDNDVVENTFKSKKPIIDVEVVGNRALDQSDIRNMSNSKESNSNDIEFSKPEFTEEELKEAETTDVEVIEVSDGKQIYEDISKDILVAAGVNDGVKVDLSSKQAEEILKANESLKEKTYALGPIIDSLSSKIPGRVKEHGEFKTTYTDDEIAKMLNKEETDEKVKDKINIHSLYDNVTEGLGDSFVPDASTTVLSDNDILRFSGIDFENDEPKIGGR